MTAAISNFADFLSWVRAPEAGIRNPAVPATVLHPSVSRLYLFPILVAIAAAAFVVPPAIFAQDRLQRIHQGDVIEIDSVGGFEFDWRGGIDSEGFLNGFTKVADPVFARCKTTDELAAAIEKEYARVLRDPTVKVRIIDRRQRANAFLDGAVRNPVRLRLNREVTLQELLVIGGGLTDRAGGDVTVFRPAGLGCEGADPGVSKTIEIRVADILAGSAEANPLIISGDIVTIHPVRNVYVIGGVATPGKTAWRDGMTVSRAVAAAGGVSGRGVKGKATIYRREGLIAKTIEVDLSAVAGGDSTNDHVVLPTDIIEVPLKGAARRTQPPVAEIEVPKQLSLNELPLRIID